MLFRVSEVLLFIFALVTLGTPSRASAWGARGHHTICDAATFLVKNHVLRQFLTSRPQMMGHLCNVPDFYWKSLGGDINAVGSPAHFFNPEVLGLAVDDVPMNFRALIATYQGQENHLKPGTKLYSLPLEFGSLWWRADQFFRRAIASSSHLREAKPPMGRQEEQNESLPFNRLVYAFLVNLGLMGHFVGDGSQPFHSNADYDGYGRGHGGVHAYYEEQAVGAQGVDLVVKIEKMAEKLQALATSKVKSEQAKVEFLKEVTPVEKMRALSRVSLRDLDQIFAIDPVIRPSSLSKENGMEIRSQATRRPIEAVAARFAPLIVAEMARSAALLAQLWDEAYEKVGKPDLLKYQSYKYPLTPDFIAPDYYDLETTDHMPAK